MGSFEQMYLAFVRKIYAKGESPNLVKNGGWRRSCSSKPVREECNKWTKAAAAAKLKIKAAAAARQRGKLEKQ